MIPARLRARIAWLAVAAMLMSVFAPGISRAMLADAAPETWGEICRADGGSGTPIQGELPAPARHGAGTGDCPFCLPQAGAPALPTPERGFTPPPDTGAIAPRLFLLAPSARWQWLPAQARAPPQLA